MDTERTWLHYQAVDAGEWAHVAVYREFNGTYIRNTTRFTKTTNAWCVCHLTSKGTTYDTAFRNKAHAEAWLEVCQSWDERHAMIKRMRAA